MKRVFYNTGLVVVLMAVFAIPLTGFGFITQQPTDSSSDFSNPNVLGISTLANHASKKVSNSNIVEQLEYTVVTSEGSTENVLYDIIPVEYLSSAKNFIVVLPNEYKELGITANIVKNENSLDLVVKSGDSLENLDIPVTVLILN